jgi:hypothetical protein
VLSAAETLGFEGYAPPYLSPLASGKNLLAGANFGSAASSYDDDTAALYVSIYQPYPRTEKAALIRSCSTVHEMRVAA